MEEGIVFFLAIALTDGKFVYSLFIALKRASFSAEVSILTNLSPLELQSASESCHVFCKTYK
jgi:hypothetical protein